MHEDFGANAGSEPDPVERAYRIDVLVDAIPEVAGLALIHRIADLLVEEGLATPEGADVRSIIGMNAHTWTPEFAQALHVVVPRAIPQSPDLGANYSPN